MLIFGFHNSRNSLLVSKLHFYSALQEDEKGKRETEETEKTKYKTRKESVYHKVKVIHLLQLNYFKIIIWLNDTVNVSNELICLCYSDCCH